MPGRSPGGLPHTSQLPRGLQGCPPAPHCNLLRVSSFAQRVRSMLQQAWSGVFGVPKPEAIWPLVHLPVRLGGFGGSYPVALHPQAALPSFLSRATEEASCPSPASNQTCKPRSTASMP